MCPPVHDAMAMQASKRAADADMGPVGGIALGFADAAPGKSEVRRHPWCR